MTNIEKLKTSISVIVPAYNEEEVIEKTINDIHTFLAKEFNDFEIIVVDDNSTDGTYAICSRLLDKISNLKIIETDKNYGKGYTVKRGILYAKSEYVLFTDADLSTPIEELDKFIDYLEDGTDIVIGSRALKESHILKSQGVLRRNMGKTFNTFVQMFLFKGIKDTQCGFKCFKRRAAHKIFKLQQLYGFSFDAEILYIARKLGYSVKEVPVDWVNREDSRVSIIKDPIKMFLDIFFIKANAARGAYENK